MKLITFILLLLTIVSCANKYEVEVFYDDYSSKTSVYESKNDSLAYYEGLKTFDIQKKASIRTVKFMEEAMSKKGITNHNLNVPHPLSFQVRSLKTDKLIDPL